MSDLLLPPKVAKEIQKEKWVAQRARYRAKLEALLDFDDPVCREWNPHLKALDPLLAMARALPLAYEPGWSVIPNFYHWVRDNENAPPTVTPITGPDGVSFAEPSSWVLEKLRASDLRDPAVFALLLEGEERYEQEQERAERERDEERQGELWERFQAATRTQVLTSTDVRWAQNSAGRRKRG